MELIAGRVDAEWRAVERAGWHGAGRLAALALAVLGLVTPPGVAMLALLGILR